MTMPLRRRDPLQFKKSELPAFLTVHGRRVGHARGLFPPLLPMKIQREYRKGDDGEMQFA